MANLKSVEVKFKGSPLKNIQIVRKFLDLYRRDNDKKYLGDLEFGIFTVKKSTKSILSLEKSIRQARNFLRNALLNLLKRLLFSAAP